MYQVTILCNVDDYVCIKDGVNIEDVCEDRAFYVNSFEYVI